MKKLLVCLTLSTVLFTGCTFLQKSEGIIKVNDQVITMAEFDKALDKSVDQSFIKSFGGSKNFLKDSKNPMYNVFKDKITNELIIKAILDQEIAKRGITATKEKQHTVLLSVENSDEQNGISFYVEPTKRGEHPLNIRGIEEEGTLVARVISHRFDGETLCVLLGMIAFVAAFMKILYKFFK